MRPEEGPAPVRRAHLRVARVLRDRGEDRVDVGVRDVPPRLRFDVVVVETGPARAAWGVWRWGAERAGRGERRQWRTRGPPGIATTIRGTRDTTRGARGGTHIISSHSARTSAGAASARSARERKARMGRGVEVEVEVERAREWQERVSTSCSTRPSSREPQIRTSASDATTMSGLRAECRPLTKGASDARGRARSATRRGARDAALAPPRWTTNVCARCARPGAGRFAPRDASPPRDVNPRPPRHDRPPPAFPL